MRLKKELNNNVIFLRNLQKEDATHAYLRWLSDPVVTAYLEVRFSPPQSLEELVSFVNETNESDDSLLLGIFLTENNQHIGNIKLGPINWNHLVGEIGFLVGDREQWGKGYASAAISLITEYAFSYLGLAKLTAGYVQENEGSRRALRKAGFVEEGRRASQALIAGERQDGILMGIVSPNLLGQKRKPTMNTGQELWRKAKRLIPGGNMLLSKRAEMFLPDLWPSYFSKAKGCKVWDLDGREYIDMCIMGIGTNTLGYSHDEVDAAVMATVRAGNMSTFNCPEEVYLAEKLLALHPWADMARFARSGGEANAIAIRIARAAVGKDNVAICGYHGWHDWYLAANLGDDNHLAGHLLPGLDPKGVPQKLRGTVFPFSYNNFTELEALVNAHDIGVIKMEVTRNHGPQDNFLQKVRDLATQRGIVLIFDECTSGFRQTMGGIHKMYGVDPDMAMFGKALGNGYAITATIGRREIMESAQSTFISSTFWTERIGPTAALKTLEIMEREKSWERISQTGMGVTERWKQLAAKHGIKINTAGLPAIASFGFEGPNALAYKTLITQEMMAKGYLATNLFFSSIAHTPDVVDGYFEVLDPVFALIKECEEGRDVMSMLKGPVCHAGFKRLN